MNANIIGLGGFGIKRAGDINKSLEELGNVTIIGIDGSDSDIREANLPEESVNLVPGADGGGKKRNLRAKEYNDFIDSNMNNIPFANLHVLVTSTTGATGSLMATRAAYNLINRGEHVIVVGVITGRSKDDTENTVKTLNNFAQYAAMAQKPIYLSLMDMGSTDENAEILASSTVDQVTISNVCEIVGIAARKYGGLDSTDLKRFFDYTDHGIEPQLTQLLHCNSAEAAAEFKGRTITQLSLVPSNDTPLPSLSAASDFRGVDADLGDREVHFLTTTVGMDQLAKTVKKRLDDMIEANKALNTKSAFAIDPTAEMEF